MSGYRRVEPAFCRGCGIPWSPGADACASCGEALEAVAKSSGDPYAVMKLKRTMIAAGLVLGGSWLLPLAFEDALLAAASGGQERADAALMLWMVLRVVLCFGVVVSARWWYPTKLEWVRPKLATLSIAVAAGVAVPVAVVVGFDVVDLGFVGLLQGAAIRGVSMPLVGVAVAALVVEELFFRGLLFSGVASFGDKTNAAIASAVLFALFHLDPILVLVGIAGAAVRAFGRTAVPAIALRLAALATMVVLAGQ